MADTVVKDGRTVIGKIVVSDSIECLGCGHKVNLNIKLEITGRDLIELLSTITAGVLRDDQETEEDLGRFNE